MQITPTQHTDTMKTQHIAAALRNAATPARLLARWQNTPLQDRLATIRRHSAPGYPCRPCSFPAVPTMADWRRALIHDLAFRLDAPMINEGESTLYHVRSKDCLDIATSETGWYVDMECNETTKAVVVRLVDFPDLVFPGHSNPWNDDLYEIDLSDWAEIPWVDFEHHTQDAISSASREKMHHAERLAELYAEGCREHDEEYQREQAAERAREERATLRGDIRALIADIRALCPAMTDTPAAMSALRRQLERMIEQRAKLMETINA